MEDTRLPLVKEIRDFLKSIENDGHDLFSALEIVLDEEYDKVLIDSCCDLRLENIKLEEAIKLCHMRFEAEKDFVRIGKATEKALNSNSNSFVTIYQYTKYVQYFNTIEELLEWAESED